LETRSLPIGFELKAVTGREITGYAAAWARDRVNDIIDSKAFDRTIRENPDVVIFVGHDASKLPVGEPVEMRADSHGLYTRSLIYDTPDGNALLEVAKQRLARGKTLGMSIGFKTVKDHWDSKQKARILEDVDLIEYSFLASPLLAANPQAVALGVKALDGTLEPIPDELQDEVRALIEAHESKAQQGMAASSYAWVDSSGTGHLDISDEGHVRAAMARFNQTHFDSPADKASAARKIVARARSMGIEVDPGSTVAQAAKGDPRMADLEDTAFAFIEPGGVLDQEQKTIPRSHRHVAHHDENGEVDLAVVTAFLENPGEEKAAISHMMAHAWDAGLFGLKSHGNHGDRTTGASRAFLEIALKALLLADRAAEDRWAMTRAGLDTKDGQRLYPASHAEAKALADLAAQVCKQAEDIERGEDGATLTKAWRTAFELLDLEEVA
jgi:HK97 family phage prohead protease